MGNHIFQKCLWQYHPLRLTFSLPHLHLAGDTERLSVSDPGFITCAMLMFVWTWLLQLSQQNPPSGLPVLDTCLGLLTWGQTLSQSLTWEVEKGTENRNQRHIQHIHSCWGVRERGWLRTSLHVYTQSGEPCSHQLPSAVLQSCPGRVGLGEFHSLLCSWCAVELWLCHFILWASSSSAVGFLCFLFSHRYYLSGGLIYGAGAH